MATKWLKAAMEKTTEKAMEKAMEKVIEDDKRQIVPSDNRIRLQIICTLTSSSPYAQKHEGLGLPPAVLTTAFLVGHDTFRAYDLVYDLTMSKSTYFLSNGYLDPNRRLQISRLDLVQLDLRDADRLARNYSPVERGFVRHADEDLQRAHDFRYYIYRAAACISTFLKQ